MSDATQPTLDAVAAGVAQGLAEAAPAALAATNPGTAAVVGLVTALEPALQQIIAMQQVGLLTPTQQAQVFAAMQANCAAAHQAWLQAIAANPGK